MTRIKEHKSDIKKNISRHRLDCNHNFNWNNIQILDEELSYNKNFGDEGKKKDWMYRATRNSYPIPMYVSILQLISRLFESPTVRFLNLLFTLSPLFMFPLLFSAISCTIPHVADWPILDCSHRIICILCARLWKTCFEHHVWNLSDFSSKFNLHTQREKQVCTINTLIL